MNTVSELAKLRRDVESLNRRLTGARGSIATANFLVLTDTPANYAGSAAKFVQVNGVPDALQFALITAEDVQAGTFPFGEYIFQAVVTGIDPTLSAHLATKEYVDTAINVEIDFFFNDTLHDIGGIYYNMRNFESGEGESTFTIGPLGGGDDQPLRNFANVSGEPGTFALPSGVFSAHIHAQRTIGNRSVEIYFELWKRTDPGGVEALLVTSELSDPIDAKTGISLHAAIGTETELNTTDILVVKWFANLGSGGPTTIALYAEGNNVSRMTIPIESSIFNAIYVRQDGMTPLTGDWAIGNFALSDIATLGLGTAVVPHGGVGWAKFAIDGPSSNAAGPHIQMTVSTDSYPTMQILNYRHDDISIRFDSYWDGANRSSDAGSNYAIFKVSDLFKIMYDSGIAKGAALAWNTGISLNTSGLVTIPGTMAAGTVTGANVTAGVDPGHTHTDNLSFKTAATLGTQ